MESVKVVRVLDGELGSVKLIRVPFKAEESGEEVQYLVRERSLAEGFWGKLQKLVFCCFKGE